MSYNGRSFKKHTGAQASQAARMTNALVKQGTPAPSRGGQEGRCKGQGRSRPVPRGIQQGMSDYQVIVEADDDRDDSKAAEIATILCEAYPGHPWHIRVGKGVIVIKHLRLSAKFGMCRHYSRVTFDAKVLKHEIVMAAGEYLERAGMARGLDRGDKPKSVEGIPQKHLVVA
jgi:hypothetical protein